MRRGKDNDNDYMYHHRHMLGKAWSTLGPSRWVQDARHGAAVCVAPLVDGCFADADKLVAVYHGATRVAREEDAVAVESRQQAAADAQVFRVLS